VAIAFSATISAATYAMMIGMIFIVAMVTMVTMVAMTMAVAIHG
jgi:hypothetical protein